MNTNYEAIAKMEEVKTRCKNALRTLVISFFAVNAVVLTIGSVIEYFA